jgi:hypothetical protein
VTFYDACDICGADLEDGRGMYGICESCEAAKKSARRVIDT